MMIVRCLGCQKTEMEAVEAMVGALYKLNGAVNGRD